MPLIERMLTFEEQGEWIQVIETGDVALSTVLKYLS